MKLYRDKIHKNLNNPLNQNVNLTKRASFASIVDNLCLCLLQQNQNADQIRIKFHRLLKKLAVVERLFNGI